MLLGGLILAVSLLLWKPHITHKRPSSSQEARQTHTAKIPGRIISSPAEFSRWLSTDFSAEKQLLTLIRNALADNSQIDELPKLNIDLNPPYAWVAVTLFQEGAEPIRFISRRKTPQETVNRIVRNLRTHRGFSDFDVANPDKCRLMLEVITSERPLDISKLNTARFDDARFEPGITGFHLKYNGADHFYMPADAAVYSHLSIDHALNYISKKIGLAEQTNRISERIKTLKGLPIKWSIIESAAFVTYGRDVLPLYRGYPVPVELSDQKIEEIVRCSAEWLYNNMTADGKFLYYYDAVRDSVIDHVHPNRTEEDNYYNILRHSGGIVALLRAYELTKDKKYVAAAENGLNFLISQTRQHDFKGKKAFYVFDNQKAKLGGTGIGLVALLRYRQTTGDKKFDDYIFGMANHLLSRIDEDGEMIGYYIHPNFNNGNPITSPTPEEKKQLFSFYYPGEALMGLALFERQMPLNDDFRREVRDDAKKALDFLVNVRPVKYADLFEPLPSDGWLMQAIEEWAYDKEFQKNEYLDFVFNDAKRLIENMYTEQNSPYYDYPGTFYYHYGDHAYVDSARAEGLIAAYFLAEKMERHELAQYILDNSKVVARSLMYSYNSPQSTYMHKFPAKSIGSFRFKFTRHWVRVDTAQHADCFFVRFLSAIRRAGQSDTAPVSSASDSPPGQTKQPTGLQNQ